MNDSPPISPQEEKPADATNYSGMNEVFQLTREILDGMQKHDRIEVGDLSEKVFAKTQNMALWHVSNLVRMYLKDCTDVTVERGARGGVYKGGKPVLVDERPRCHTCHQLIRLPSKLN